MSPEFQLHFTLKYSEDVWITLYFQLHWPEYDEEDYEQPVMLLHDSGLL
jgi:hypothetical protein